MHFVAWDTFDSVDVLSRNHHVFLLVLACVSELSQTVELLAWTKLLLLSSIHHHLLGQVLNDFNALRSQFLQVEVFEALVIIKFTSTEFFWTDRALDHDLRTDAFNMLSQLASRQMLILFNIANITAKLGTLVILDMVLEFIDGHPFDFWARHSPSTSVRKFAEFN